MQHPKKTSRFETHYAPAAKSSDIEINADFKDIKSHEFIERIFNTLPYIVTVLNKNRQVVFTNKSALDQFGVEEITNLLGKRTGEIVNCIHSEKMPAGCGTTENCKVCGAVNTILESMSTGKSVKKECRITAYKDENEVSMDFEISSSPLIFRDQAYYIVSMIDISSDKRRRVLERIFFHDILNTAGNMAGLIEIINEKKDIEDTDHLFKIVTSLSKEIIEEIHSQKVLLLAETGELDLSIRVLELPALLEDLKDEFSLFQNKKCNLAIHYPKGGLELYSDRVVLSRILKNMVKNAVEASSLKDTVSLSVEKNGTYIRFCVHNPSYMPVESQLQIFRRNFSTKGLDRGIGTYSMKVLGENYLNGKMSFKSTNGEGTFFYFDHPV